MASGRNTLPEQKKIYCKWFSYAYGRDEYTEYDTNVDYYNGANYRFNASKFNYTVPDGYIGVLNSFTVGTAQSSIILFNNGQMMFHRQGGRTAGTAGYEIMFVPKEMLEE